MSATIYRDDVGNRYHDPQMTHRIYAAAGPGGATDSCTRFAEGCHWRSDLCGIVVAGKACGRKVVTAGVCVGHAVIGMAVRGA